MIVKRLILVAAMIGALTGCDDPGPMSGAKHVRQKVTLIIDGSKYFEWTCLGRVQATTRGEHIIHYRFTDEKTGKIVDVGGERAVLVAEQIADAEKPGR